MCADVHPRTQARAKIRFLGAPEVQMAEGGAVRNAAARSVERRPGFQRLFVAEVSTLHPATGLLIAEPALAQPKRQQELRERARPERSIQLSNRCSRREPRSLPTEFRREMNHLHSRDACEAPRRREQPTP